MGILKYLDDKEETKPLQVHVPVTLREAVDAARAEDDLTLNAIVIAGLKSYLEERVTKRKRKE